MEIRSAIQKMDSIVLTMKFIFCQLEMIIPVIIHPNLVS